MVWARASVQLDTFLFKKKTHSFSFWLLLFFFLPILALSISLSLSLPPSRFLSLSFYFYCHSISRIQTDAYCIFLTTKEIKQKRSTRYSYYVPLIAQLISSSNKFESFELLGNMFKSSELHINMFWSKCFTHFGNKKKHTHIRETLHISNPKWNEDFSNTTNVILVSRTVQTYIVVAMVHVLRLTHTQAQEIHEQKIETWIIFT